MRIGDLVRHKDDIVFENDVQLDWYPSDPRNRGLVGGYMFTRNAPPGKRSSIQMLEDLRAAIEHGKPNRFVAIANYGRGKTHFALALANFFGKPADSEEVRLLLRNIEHVTDRGVAQHFREFKERRPPFLVLRIRGDDVAPLYQQVMRGLEKAVRELTGNAAERLPLWFDSALSFLERLAPEQVTQANQFLATRYPEAADYSPLTYEMLSTWVRERRPDAYEPCRELFACFHGGTYPDFGGLVGIKEALASVIERYCRGDQPQAGGVLVLFDELSVFIQRNAGPQGGRLQDLLDGVRDHPHHAVCIAFAQHDPNVVVSWTLRNPEDPARQRIEKELDRFDKASRHSLHSTLETVLDAHLQPNSEEAFSTFYRRHLPAFDRAQDMTLELFADRYAPPDWSCDTFEKVVTKGCFPLHPLTTALFADMEIGEIATTRNVLGLLRKEIETFAQMEAVVDGRPNWIYPIAMVDWFREALGNEHYRAYLAANEKVGADATQVQKDLLKALLLCAAASALSKSPRFDTLMEHLTGHPRSECIEHLKRLNRAGYIQYDDHRKVYRLWPAGADPAKLDRELAQEVARRSLDRARLDEIARRWRSSGRLPTLEIRDVTWGHLSDWECDQVLATKETLTTGWLRSLATTYGLDSAKGLRDGVRGVLVQIIAETPGELVKHEEAETLLREALDCDAPPVVLALPMDPSPNIRRLLLEEQVLQDWAGKQEIYGADIYRNATVTKRSAIDDALSRLKKNNILCVHPDHQAQGLGTDETDERFVRRMFKTRYRFAPPAFFTQYKTNSSKLMKATGIVAEALFSGAPEMHQNLIESDPVAKDLYAKYIRRGSPGSWELTSGGHELIEPRGERTLKAWEHLDGVFARGVVRVKVSDGIMPLLNPPYGYDWNTALLLFAAWFGYNRSEITLERKGLPIRIEDIGRFRELLKKPKDFWGHVCYVDQITLSRSDPAKEEGEIRELIRTTLSETIHVEEARRRAARLRAFADDAARNPDLRRQAKSCADNLARQIEKAQEYGSQQDQILAAVGQQQSVTVLVRCLGQLKELPILERVKEEDWEPADGLRQKLVEAIGELVRRKCRDYAGIRRVEDYTQRQTALRTLKKQVQEVADPSLTSEVDTALEELDRGLQELRARQDDDRLVAQAQAMDPSAPLAKLDANVVMLKAMSPKSQAARDIIAAKQAELAESARNARLWVQTVTDRLAAIDTVDGARNLRDAILRRQDLYADTPERNRLDDAASKCELIADTLERADEIAASKFGSPSELERALERIRELRDTNARKLESAQVARLDDARAALERRRDDLSERARKWLDDCERDLKVGTDPGKLLEKLDRPHPFLPATEVARVSRLREAAVALRDKAERERQERERKRRELDEAEKHDRMLISEAHRMSSNGTLSALRSDLNRLQEMRPRTERGNAEIDRRRKDLADAIAKVEHGLRSACARLDSIDASQKAHQLEIELSRMLALCSGCPEHEDIEGCAKRCERVKRYLTAIEEIRSSRLQAPADADHLLGRISAALTEAGDVLSDIQRSVARSAEDEIRTRVEKSSLQARQWLEDLETREAQGADPVDLQRLLAKVPAFLPSEDATRLEALRQRVQDRIDADEVASVLERFCRIQSRAKREECLQRLQVLLSQENLA